MDETFCRWRNGNDKSRRMECVKRRMEIGGKKRKKRDRKLILAEIISKLSIFVSMSREGRRNPEAFILRGRAPQAASLRKSKELFRLVVLVVVCFRHFSFSIGHLELRRRRRCRWPRPTSTASSCHAEAAWSTCCLCTTPHWGKICN